MFGRVPGLVACGPSGGAGPVIAFELVRSAEQLWSLFGSEPCTSTLVKAQREALWLDLLAFIPAYTVFLALGAFALRRSGLLLALITMSIFMAAGTFDEIEGAVLFKILGAMPGTPLLYDALFWTVRPKFALLGVGEILLAALLWRGPLLAKIASGLLLAGGLASLYFLFNDPYAPGMMKGHTYAWGALLVVALIGAVRPDFVTREAA
ncbi:MAG: hypothetical protein EOP62_03675 [Sphingomonadales bacterium]|nr:MAG: hypothetical protein EOP62_03675 [Sphingomonadales bacterium]